MVFLPLLWDVFAPRVLSLVPKGLELLTLDLGGRETKSCTDATVNHGPQQREIQMT